MSDHHEPSRFDRWVFAMTAVAIVLFMLLWEARRYGWLGL